MPKRPGRTNAEASATTRAALLEAGGTAFIEQQAAGHPFKGLTTRSICERAGYSTGAFYAHWSDVESYYEDLGRLLLGPDDDLFQEDFNKLEEAATKFAKSDLVQGLLKLGDLDFDLLLKNPLWDAMPTVSATWGRTRLRREAADGYAAIDSTTIDIYMEILAAHGREIRAPLTPKIVGALLQALIEGLGLRSKIDPESTSWTTDEAKSLYAIGAACILAIMSREKGDDSDLFATLHQLTSRRGEHE